MGILEGSSGKNGILTVVFATLLFTCLVVSYHEASAHGPPPGSCTNEYDGTFVIGKMNNGTQTFNGGSFEANIKTGVKIWYVMKMPALGGHGNTLPGQTWLSYVFPTHSQGICGGTYYPNENVTVSSTISQVYASTTQNGGLCTKVNCIGWNITWINSSPSPAIANAVPGEPTNLSAWGWSSSQIMLGWNQPANSTVTGYRIDRSSDGGSTWSTIVPVTSSNSTTFADSNLLSHVTYYYRVAAVNSIGTGAPSGMANATTFYPVLTVNSQNMTGSGISGLNATFSQGGSRVGTGSTTIPFYLTSPGPYYLTVFNTSTIAFDHWLDTGSQNATRIVSIQNDTVLTAVVKTAPTAPTGLKATQGQSSQVNLSWMQPSSDGGSAITNYKIYRGTSPGTETVLVTIGNLAYYNDTSTASNETYFYRVSAVNVAGESPQSNEVSATATVSSPPQNLQAVRGSYGVDVTWNPPASNGGSPITNYKVYRGTSSGGETYYTDSPPDSSLTDGMVSNGQTYYYKVTAVNWSGESAPSDEASVTALGVPHTPSINATAGNAQVALAWSAPNNGGYPITGYEIARYTLVEPNPVYISVGNVTSYTDVRLTDGLTYYYSVKAENGAGSSADSNIASATPSSQSSAVLFNSVQSASVPDLTSPYQVTISNFGVGSAANRLLVVGISSNNNAVKSVTFGGMPLARGPSSYYNNDAEFWYLTNPSGSGDVVVTMGGRTSVVVGAYALSGVDLASPVASYATKYSSTGGPDIAITTKYPNDMVLDLPSVGGGSIIGSPTCTEEWNTNWSVTGASSSITEPSPGPVDCSWVSDGNSWDDIAVEIKAASSNPVTTPASPQNLQATVGNGQVVLSWSAPANNGGSAITNYKIYRGNLSGSETILTTIGNVTSYNDNAVTNGQAYFYKITAVNSVGESSQSNEATAAPTSGGSGTTSGITLNNVQSTSDTTSSSNQITLSNFNPGSGSSNLLVVGVGANNAAVNSVTFGGASLTKAVSSFFNNDAEFWYMTNPSGTGNIVVTMSGPTSAVVGAYSFSGVNQTMPIPTHLAKHNTTPNSPNISITTKYANDLVLDLPSIYGGEKLGSPVCTQQWNVNVSNAIASASSSTMVQSPTTVTCKWTASSSDMWDDVAVEIGSYTTSGTNTGTTATAPSVPTGLAATPGNAQVTLSWTVPASNGGSTIMGYKVYRSTSSGTEAFLTQAGNVTSYVDNTMTNGQTYYYRVTAVNSAGESPQSNEAGAIPTAPSGSGSTSGIVLNNIQSTSGTADSSNQIMLSNFNATAGADRLLVVGVSANNNNVGSITFAGVQLTREVSHFTNNDAEFWYLINPAGTGDITVTMNGPTQAVVGAYSFSGVNQTVPIPVHITRHNLTPSSPAISITTSHPNDWVLDLPSIWGGVTLGSPTCTQQWDANVAGQITGASSSTVVPSPATVTCSWAASSDNMWDDVAVELKSN